MLSKDCELDEPFWPAGSTPKALPQIGLALEAKRKAKQEDQDDSQNWVFHLPLISYWLCPKRTAQAIKARLRVSPAHPDEAEVAAIVAFH
jgi:hypothetical protein